MEIRSAQNGFILVINGREHIATSLMQAAKLAGEYIVDPGRVEYNKSSNTNSVFEVRDLAHNGNKIGAIKALRGLYTHTIGLREAKDLVEAML
jgi:ribosomal protein L7/L12